MKSVFLALGTNMGDRAVNLRGALERLHPAVSIEKRSKVYESEPMYTTEQPRFYNMVVRGSTTLTPRELLQHAKSIEADLGRMPDSHNQPRPIDIDILLFGEEIWDAPDLIIPHPRMHERAFVLVPLDEIAPSDMHPVLRRPIADLLGAIGNQSGSLWEAAEQL